MHHSQSTSMHCCNGRTMSHRSHVHSNRSHFQIHAYRNCSLPDRNGQNARKQSNRHQPSLARKRTCHLLPCIDHGRCKSDPVCSALHKSLRDSSLLRKKCNLAIRSICPVSHSKRCNAEVPQCTGGPGDRSLAGSHGVGLLVRSRHRAHSTPHNIQGLTRL